MLHVTKLFPNQDLTMFHAFGRVISGTCKSVTSPLVKLLPLRRKRVFKRKKGEERGAKM